MCKKIFVKNSSSDINFGYYDVEIIVRTDGGRLYLSKEYGAKLEVDEKTNKLKVILCEKP